MNQGKYTTVTERPSQSSTALYKERKREKKRKKKVHFTNKCPPPAKKNDPLVMRTDL
jgi:hypothetical protein